jgi:hypothetical protein
MVSSKYKYFLKKNFLELSVHDNLYSELLSFESQNEIVIDTLGNITTNAKEKNHLRNNCLDESFLDSVLSPYIRQVKDCIRPLVAEQGLQKPMLKGLKNYNNPFTIKWHKDYVTEDMRIEDSKRFITFLVVSPGPIKSNFMVSSSADSVKLWNLGFVTDLEPNMLMGHNQYMGHEYNKIQDSNVCIFSLLWYDSV